MKQFEEKISKKHGIKSIGDFPISGVYIIFNKLEDKVKVWELYKEYNKSNPWNKIFFCCPKKKKTGIIPQKHIFKGKHLLHIEDAEEPVNIFWEN